MKKNMIKKLLAVATAVILLLSVLGISALAAEKDEVVKDLTYEVENTVIDTDGDEFDDYSLNTTVIVKDGKIADITAEGFGDAYENPEYLATNRKRTANAVSGVLGILQGTDATIANVETVKVDAISNATRSTTAIKEALITAFRTAEAATTEPEIETYTVTYMYNGETLDEQEVEEGTTVTASSVRPSLEDGYVFVAWTDGTAYSDGGMIPFDFSTPITQDVILTPILSYMGSENATAVNLGTIPVKKVVEKAANVAEPNETYYFSVTPGANTPAYTTALTTNGAGDLNLGYVEYPDGPGLYTYTIKEVAGNNPDIVYDTSEYEIQVRVEMGTDNKLKITKFSIAPVSDPTNKTTSLTFTNKYFPATELTVKKVVKDASDIEKGRKFDFTINFTDPQTGSTVTVKEGEDTQTITYGANYEFELADGNTITFYLPAGTEYKLTETGVTSYQATAQVISDGKAQDDVSGNTGASITVNSVAMINENSVTVTNTYKVNALTGLARKNAGVIVLMLVAAAVIAYLVYDKKRKLATEQE